jgi:hypothetical protein
MREFYRSQNGAVLEFVTHRDEVHMRRLGESCASRVFRSWNDARWYINTTGMARVSVTP